MEEIVVCVDEKDGGKRPVSFSGEKLGQRVSFGIHNGCVSDVCGVTETLYRTSDGRLMVHIHNWSRWPGEPESIETVCEVTEEDLDPDGEFQYLGWMCDFGRWATVDPTTVLAIYENEDEEM